MAIKQQKQFVLFQTLPATLTTASADQKNNGCSGVRIWFKSTAKGVAPSVKVMIQGLSPQGDYYKILESAAITTVTTVELLVHPSIAASANLIANTKLPANWRVLVTVTNGDSFTYGVTGEYLV